MNTTIFKARYIVSGFLICVWNIKKTMKPILMKIEQNMSSSLSISWSLIWLWCSWLWMTNSICFHKWHWILIISQSYWNWLLKKKTCNPMHNCQSSNEYKNWFSILYLLISYSLFKHLLKELFDFKIWKFCANFYSSSSLI